MIVKLRYFLFVLALGAMPCVAQAEECKALKDFRAFASTTDGHQIAMVVDFGENNSRKPILLFNTYPNPQLPIEILNSGNIAVRDAQGRLKMGAKSVSFQSRKYGEMGDLILDIDKVKPEKPKMWGIFNFNPENSVWSPSKFGLNSTQPGFATPRMQDGEIIGLSLGTFKQYSPVNGPRCPVVL